MRGRRQVQGLSWLFGLALTATLVLVVVSRSEEREFARLMEHAQPAWLLLGLALQALTYPVDGAIWWRVLHRSGGGGRLLDLASLVLAKLFVDQAVPTGGVSGTYVVVRGLERRGAPRPVVMAAVVLDLTSYYAAYVLALGSGLAIAAHQRALPTWLLVPCLLFGAFALSLVALLNWLPRAGRGAMPAWLHRVPLLAPLLQAVAEGRRDLARSVGLLLGSVALQVAIVGLDAGTMWAMLRAVGGPAAFDRVWASFAFATLARTLGVVPGGLGTFEAASVGTLSLLGVPASAGLAATLLFRGLSFYLPLVPGVLVARRETAAKGR